MALRLVVTFQAAPGKAQDFAEAFKPLQAITHAEEGCEQYELLQSLDDPHRLVLLERWTSEGLLQKHLDAMRARGGSPTSRFQAEGSSPTFERYEV